MSLYNILFSENEEATALLGMIGVTREDFQRYRDVNLNPEGNVITVLTRIGGGNRRDYKDVFKIMKKNPNYIKNYDDGFDKTYAYFEFKVPEKYKQACKMMAPKERQLTLKEMFDKEIEESKIPGSEASKRMDKIVESILGSIENGNHFISL